MRSTKAILWLSTITLLSSGLWAQPATEKPLAPGSIVKFDITFDGPDAAKVKTVRVYLIRKTEVPPDQYGFSATPQAGDFSPSPSGVFKTEIKIPEGTPTGYYALQVLATGENNSGSVNYDAGKEFQLHRFHIDNPAKFTPPHINVKELP